MQGHKNFNEKIFYQVSLSDLVPRNNFYRRLKKLLDLGFLYKSTKKYYGMEGQESIDPVVFFKICLVGYLNNITSDRKLIDFCSDSLSIRFFIDYDIDEKLPWHSTISRTRQLYEEEIFQSVFRKILSQCAEAGLVAGHTQVIDSAFVKANASMDSLEVKVPSSSLEDHLKMVDGESNKENVSENENQPQMLSGGGGQGKKKGRQKTSNKTHHSPVDPDARISRKPGKPTKLNYYSQVSVDTSHQIITQIQADLADQKDSQCLQSLVSATVANLKQCGVEVENILADSNYSSGANYAWLEDQGLTSFIAPHGKYKGGPSGFTYVESDDYWICRNDVKILFRKKWRTKSGVAKKTYTSNRHDCSTCSFKADCLGKNTKKRIEITAHKPEYDRAIERIKKNKWIKVMRTKIVEPVFGTLINYQGMSKLNTRGLGLANKCMLMSATAFNLKKLFKYAKPQGRPIPNIVQMTKNALEKAQNSIKKPLLPAMLFSKPSWHQ